MIRVETFRTLDNHLLRHKRQRYRLQFRHKERSP